MTPLRFQLDGSPIWEGFWTGETWNGAVVPWVTPETREAIAAWVAAQPDDGDDGDGENAVTASQLRALSLNGGTVYIKLDLGLTFYEAEDENV